MQQRTMCLAAALAAAAVFASAGASFAADGAAVLAAYQGEWRGSGEAKPNPQSKPMRISCRISATYDAADAALVNTGKCGSTQGSRQLDGALRLEGDSVTGDFLGSAAAPGMTAQRVRVVDGAIVSEGEMENAGKVLKMRTLFTPPRNGAFVVQSQFFDYATRSWVKAGEIEFRRQ